MGLLRMAENKGMGELKECESNCPKTQRGVPGLQHSDDPANNVIRAASNTDTSQRQGRERIKFKGLKAVVVCVNRSEVHASKKMTREALTEKGPPF
ncbi:hypothetical protein FF1_006888 [Malus domestica]